MKVQVDVKENDFLGLKLGYKIIIPLSCDTQITKTLSESEMETLLDDISSVLGYKAIMEKFNCKLNDAKYIKKEIDSKPDCKNCDLKMIECYRCCKVCESPLERDLFKALIKNGINVELQMRINKDNSISHFPEEIEPAKILTIPDFYLKTEDKKICIYTDGHTYHERTEYQATRDRSIDRNLQNLGYIVLRYTSSEIRQGLENVIKDIKKNIGNEKDFNNDFNENEVSSDSLMKTMIDEGTCIRCGSKIKYNINKPLCEDCYLTWSQFRNIDYIERYCHKCGNEIENYISYKQALCNKCSYYI